MLTAKELDRKFTDPPPPLFEPKELKAYSVLQKTIAPIKRKRNTTPIKSTSHIIFKIFKHQEQKEARELLQKKKKRGIPVTQGAIINAIKKGVADVWTESVPNICSHNRKQMYAAPRSVAMFLLRYQTKIPLTKIGAVMSTGKPFHHASVIHLSTRVVDKLSMGEPEFVCMFRAVIEHLKNVYEINIDFNDEAKMPGWFKKIPDRKRIFNFNLHN